MNEQADIAIIGAGAAGLMAAIWAGRTHRDRRIVVLDGAKTIGRKILIAGGGRCNVTHFEVSAEAYAGSSRNAIKKVLRRFDVAQTIAFFRELGVELKQEETGKLFPTSDKAATILDALLRATHDVGVEIHHPRRVERIIRQDGVYQIQGDWGTLSAPALVLATGGKSVPQTGSDGHGYTLAQALGHTLTPRIFPALVPLTLPSNHFVCGLSGLTLPTTLTVTSGTGKRLISFTDSTLCTHSGLSGPAVLDVSRYYIDAKLDDPAAQLLINWLPDVSAEALDTTLQSPGKRSILNILRDWLPDRLAQALLDAVAIDPATVGDQLTRVQRRGLVTAITALPLPINGNRGFKVAEVTAGGVPLTEIQLKTMGSRLSPGLHLCGEICDVDGRIGGFNFQWAWASGYVVGVSIGDN